MSSSIKQITLTSLCILSLSSATLAADRLPNMHRWYAGLTTGYSSTDWRFLLPHCGGDSPCETALKRSAPIAANDAGIFTGAYLGYNITSHVAFEMNLVRMGNSRITFDEHALTYYPQLSEDTLSITSHTYTFNWVIKLSTPIMDTNWYGFLDAGAGITRRSDKLGSLTHTNPTFGMGIGRIYNQRYQLELFGQYTAGFDHADLSPANDYVPFLTQVGIKCGVLFDL